ncbi:MAG: CBS domain-containing protein [Saprospiraceae bacterium]|nr:CBS domain-containing protein [Saprospiraceae bacterium]
MDEIRIQDIMTTDLYTVNHDDILSEVAKLFEKHSFHHVPVVNNDGDLEGVISSSDLQQMKSGASFFRNPKKEERDAALMRAMRVCDIMTKDITTLQPTDSIRRAYEVFKKNKFHAIPILDRGKLSGIITPLDLLDHFFKQN